eukprot:CAMPEP_0198256166 /NCGR_PEP_ID=MMETSP1447-20131203/6148_1 /TAXON_ID=420782 /ORGANISM="Chaetoceros dichaeta, Strain CCMP1751" /LENGTH=344 /DNA_ID=CAMNT_0043942743 /DNA_START=88 /DNA_END=1122 /DNA_ORIENTATION=+
MKLPALCIVLALERSTLVSSFSTTSNRPSTRTFSPILPFSATSSDDQTTTTTTKTTSDTSSSPLFIPVTFDEMVKQSSSAMEDAYAAGITRQTVRILLPRSPDNDQLGRYYENDADINGRISDSILVPPDETWQGGIMQLYRAASITCQGILRRYSRNAGGGVVPRLREDRSIDETGVDGMGLWISEGTSSKEDVCCFVQPSQETVNSIEAISKEAGSDRLVVLMNPQWRITDDALDSYSRSEGMLGTLASFLGGKGNSIRRLEEIGFDSTYIIEGYVCKGGNIRLLKRFDSDWNVFAENDAGTDYIPVGTSESRPTYQEVDAMLDDKGITLKYARDMGMAPKL